MQNINVGKLFFAKTSMTWKGFLVIPVFFAFGHWFAVAAQNSMCAFDPCQPMSWWEKWDLPLIGSMFLIGFTVLSDIGKTKIATVAGREENRNAK